jgi:tRNA (mo5U34)-methyltransferase
VSAASQAELREAVVSNQLWYHTMELPGGIVTPGWFDLRSIVDSLPWPDVRGKRCLDVGTYDGFLAFEMERRGAAEVVALDIPNHEDWDWPPDVRAKGPDHLALIAGPEKGVGFRIAREALGSNVEKVDMNVYELEPGRVGTFDVVVCGSLMLHLRDPLRALEGIRTVCDGEFMSLEQIELRLTLTNPRRPLFRLKGTGGQLQWWVPNTAGHRQMVHAAGFEVLQTTRPYSEAFGEGHWSKHANVRQIPRRLAHRLLTGDVGVPHAALLARPRV